MKEEQNPVHCGSPYDKTPLRIDDVLPDLSAGRQPGSKKAAPAVLSM